MIAKNRDWGVMRFVALFAALTTVATLLALAAAPAQAQSPPTFVSAEVDGTTLTVEFSENLKTTSVPAPGDFHVTVAGSRRNVASGGVAIAGAKVTLTLASAVSYGETVLVRYTKPSSNPLQSAGGTDVATFADQAVTNTTTLAISNVELVSKPRTAVSGGKVYGQGQPIVVAVTWAAPVSWDLGDDDAAELRVRLQVGNKNRTAKLVTDGARKGTETTLWFSYTAVAADTDTDGVAVVPPTSGSNKGRVVFTHRGATVKDAEGRNAGWTHTGLSASTAHKVDGSKTSPQNSGPLFDDEDATTPLRTMKTVNAIAGNLGSLFGVADYFNDADGDNLRFVTSFERPDMFAATRFIDPTFHYLLKGHCALSSLVPALTVTNDVFEQTFKITAYDPDGLSVTATATFRTPVVCRELVSATVNGTALTLTYHRDLPSGSPWRMQQTRDRFEVMVDGTEVALAQNNAISVSGKTLVLTLATAVTRNQAVTVSFEPGGGGQQVRRLADQRVTNANDTVPESATINGSTMTITFNRNLALESGAVTSGLNPGLHWAFSAVGLYAAGAPLRGVSPRSVSVSGKAVTLDFGPDIVPGKQVAVAYLAWIAKQLSSGLLDAGDNSRVPTVSRYSVTNNTPGTAAPLLLSGQVAGTELTLTFDSDLDASSAPSGSRFAVVAFPANTYASGDSVDPDDPATWDNPARLIPGTGTATVSGKTATVTLAAAVAQDETAAAWYQRGNDAKPLRATSAGERVGNLSSRVRVLDRTPPTVVDGVAAGTSLVLYFSEKLDTSSTPATSAFTVRSIAGSTPTNRTVSSVAMSEDAVTLTLGSAPGDSDTVTVAYNRPATDPIRDREGNSAPTDTSPRTVTNAGATDPGAPSLAATSPAVADYLVLRLAFDSALDPERVPGTDAFTLTDSVSGNDLGLRIAGVAVRGSKLELGISPGFLPCQRDVSVSYAKPTENALRNVWGTDAAAFSNQAVTNAHAGKCRHFGSRQIPVIRIAAGGGGTGGLSMDFRQRMNSRRVPSPDGFTVRSTTPGGDPAAPVAVESTEFSSDARQLHLALSRRLDPGEQVTVSYREPRSGTGLWDADGNQIAPFSAQGVVPGAAPAVTGVEVVSDAGGDDTYAMGETISLRVTFSAAVDVVGAPTLGIDMDPAHWGRKDAVYAGGSGTTELTFTHTVIEPNYSSQGIAVLADTLALNGGTIQAAADGTDADLAHTGLGHDPAHKVDWRQSPPDAHGNRSPVFRGTNQAMDSAYPGYLLTLRVSKDDFHDPDGDSLTFALSASRDDVHVPGGFGYIEQHGRIWFQAKTACALAGLAPPTGDAYYTVITLTATDPDGATAQAAATFRTNPTEFACPSLSSAAVDGDTLTITLAADGLLPLSFSQPAAEEFVVKADGTAVSLAATGAVSADDTEIVLRLASPVTASQIVTVSYTPGDDAMAAAFTEQAVTNNTPAPEEPSAPKKLESPDEPATLDGPTAPTGASVSGNELTLTFNRDLAAVDDATASRLRFGFFVDGAFHYGTPIAQSPNRVVVDGATVTLTLGTAVLPGDDVTVTYSAAARGLQLADGTPLPDFTTTLTTTQRD